MSTKLSEMLFQKDTLFLVTGGAGFIGSNICKKIIELGYKVICLDDLSTGKIQNIESLVSKANFTFHQGDIRDLNTCIELTKGVDYVLHQAAWGSVPRSVKMPIDYEINNIKGTLNVFEAARINNVKKVVYASSSSVYGDDVNLPKIEGKEGNVLSPYALTKKVDELYGRLYSELYGLDTVGLRYFNVFGPNQDPEGDYAAVIPKFVSLLLNRRIPTINGDGSQSRDFTYIDNVVEANLLAAASNQVTKGKSYNIANGGQYTLNDLYNRIASSFGIAYPPFYGQEREGDIKHSNADISRAMIDFGYSPVTSFEDGLLKYIEWFKHNYEKK